MRNLLLVCIAVITLWAAAVRGQEQQPAVPQAADQQAAAQPTAAEAALPLPQADRAAVVRAMLDRSRLLDDAHFTVPVSVWQDYVRARNDAAGLVEPPPVPYILSQAEYHVTVGDKAAATLTVSLRWEIFKADECRNLPALSADLAWNKVTLSGHAADLPTVDGWLRVTPKEPGPLVLTAETPLKDMSFRLKIPRSIQTFARVDAGTGLEFTAAGATQSVVGTAEGGTHGRLGLTPCDQLDITLQPPRVHYDKAARFQLTGDVIWTLGSGSRRVEANLAVGLVGGTADRIDLALPAGADRVAVTGPDVRDVQTSGGRATVFLRGRIAEKTRLAVSCELPASSGAASLDGFSVADGHWAGGTLVVTSAESGSEVLPQTSNGLADMPLTQIPASASAMMAATPVLAYSITSRQWSVGVETIDLSEYALRETVADIAHYELTFRPDGTLMCKASYEIRNRTQQFLRFDLPRGSQVLLVRVNEKPQPLTAVAGAEDAYQVPLVRSMASVKGLVSFPVEIVLLCRAAPLNAKGQARIPLPRVNMPIAYAWCEAYLPREMAVTDWAGAMRRVNQFSSETAVATLDYGRGELAEGYSEAQRPKFDQAVDEARAKEEWQQMLAKPTTISGGALVANGNAIVLPTAKDPAAATTAPTGKNGNKKDLDRQDGDGDAAKIEGSLFTATPEPVNGPSEEKPGGKQPSPTTEVGGVSLPVKGTKAITLHDEPDIDKLSLARNYFRAGRDYYEQGDFDNASKSLEQASKLAPGSVEAMNSDRLLGNIKVQQGQTKVTSKSEKAAAAEVYKGLSATNAIIITEQKKLLEEGEATLKQGNREEALTKLNAAKALTEKLQRIGVVEQKDQLVELTKQIEGLNKDREGQLQAYQMEIGELTKAGRYEEALQAAQEAKASGADVPQQQMVDLALKAETQRIESRRSRVSTSTSGGTFGLGATQGLAAGSGRPSIPQGGAGGGGGQPPPPPGNAPSPSVEEVIADIVRDVPAERREDVRTYLRSVVSAGYLDATTKTPAANQAEVTPELRAQLKAIADGALATAGHGSRSSLARELDRRPAAALDDTTFEKSMGYRSPGPAPTGQADLEKRTVTVETVDRVTTEKLDGYEDARPDSSMSIRQQDVGRKVADPVARQRVIDDLWKQSEALAGKYQYREASQMLDQILVVDPDNDKAQRYRMDYDYLAGLSEQVNVRGSAAKGERRAETEEAATPNTELYRYRSAKDWADLTAQRRKFVTEAGGQEQPVTSSFVGDLRTNVPDFGKTVPRTTVPPADQGVAWPARPEVSTMHFDLVLSGDKEKVKSVLEDAVRRGDVGGTVTIEGNRAAVTGTAEQQARAKAVLDRLEAAVGPQVEQGQTLALQQARSSGQVDDIRNWSGIPPDNPNEPQPSATMASAGVTNVYANQPQVGGNYSLGYDGRTIMGSTSYELSARRETDGTRTVTKADKEAFNRYVASNYSWQWMRNQTGGGQAPTIGNLPVLGSTFSNDATPRRGTNDSWGLVNGNADELARKLDLNLGQNVRVNSTDLNVTAAQASSLGVTFNDGANGLKYATADEAQFRTLAELSARRLAENGDNTRSQFTIVGTDALLSNGMTANVRFAGDRTNTLDIADNDLKLEHERYVLIDNGGTVTAIRADKMQHWTELPSSNPFAVVPQTVDVPRVGQRVKLEKTLVEPTDELVIQVEYVWKGAER